MIMRLTLVFMTILNKSKTKLFSQGGNILTMKFKTTFAETSKLNSTHTINMLKAKLIFNVSLSITKMSFIDSTFILAKTLFHIIEMMMSISPVMRPKM